VNEEGTLGSPNLVVYISAHTELSIHNLFQFLHTRDALHIWGLSKNEKTYIHNSSGSIFSSLTYGTSFTDEEDEDPEEEDDEDVDFDFCFSV
jgi:hypothetical protein